MIQLKNDYVIDIEDRCYSLAKCRGACTKDGKPKYDENGDRIIVKDVKGYFIKLDQAVAAYSDEIAKEKLSDKTFSLKEAIDIIRQTREEISEMVRKGTE